MRHDLNLLRQRACLYRTSGGGRRKTGWVDVYRLRGDLLPDELAGTNWSRKRRTRRWTPLNSVIMKLTDVYDWKRRGPGKMVRGKGSMAKEGTLKVAPLRSVMLLRNCVLFHRLSCGFSRDRLLWNGYLVLIIIKNLKVLGSFASLDSC